MKEIKNKKKTIIKTYRPLFHFTPKKGWINDPNGLIKIGDTYTLFAQHNPYDVVWGPMHWLHMETNDLIAFKEFNECALIPSESYDDKFGCFSGSAILKDNKIHLMYTGACDNRQVQCLAVENNGNYEKYKDNPVIDEKLLSEEYAIADFRDPKVIKENDAYYCFLVSKRKLGDSSLLLYKSFDLIHWSFVSVILDSSTFNGDMFECPDIVRINEDKVILLISLQGYKIDDIANKSIVLACYGQMDFINGKFVEIGKWQRLDEGFDFYATQTSYSKDNRPLLIAWMYSWGGKNYAESEGWCGRFTLPRLLTIGQDSRIYQHISNELDKYEKKVFESKSISKTNIFSKEHSLKFLDVTIDADKKDITNKSIKLCSDNEYFELTLLDDNRIKLDRSNCINKLDTDAKKHDYIRYAKTDSSKSILKLRIIIDVSSIEIEIDDGYSMMSFNFYPQEPRYSLCIDSNNEINNFKCIIKTNKDVK